MTIERRRLLGLAAATSALAVLPRFARAEAPRPPARFPAADPDRVREVVAAAHGNKEKVVSLLSETPDLAKSAIDWGFGDWESALGAASHMGRRDIATVLLDHGARPTIFSAAMLGQLDVVKAFVAAQPGVQRLAGPHGFSLLHHARQGGDDARDVVVYLEGLGDADPTVESHDLAAEDIAAWVGAYRYGPGDDEFVEVSEKNGGLRLGRPGQFARALVHRGNLRFHASGAPSSSIRFGSDGSTLAVFIDLAGGTLVARRM